MAKQDTARILKGHEATLVQIARHVHDICVGDLTQSEKQICKILKEAGISKHVREYDSYEFTKKYNNWKIRR